MAQKTIKKLNDKKFKEILEEERVYDKKKLIEAIKKIKAITKNKYEKFTTI